MPPFARALFQRQQFNNPPFLIGIHMGQNAFDRAKEWNSRVEDCAGLVLLDDRPGNYLWPVRGSICLIEWHQGPALTTVAELAHCLARAGALSVASSCLFDVLPTGRDRLQFNPTTNRWAKDGFGMHLFSFNREVTANVGSA